MANLSKQKKIKIMINEIACDDFYIITTVNNRRFENKWLINIVEELVYMRANFLMANLSKQKKTNKDK